MRVLLRDGAVVAPALIVVDSATLHHQTAATTQTNAVGLQQLGYASRFWASLRTNLQGCLQVTSDSGLFHPDSVDNVQGTDDQSQLLRANFAEVHLPPPHAGQQVAAGSSLYISRGKITEAGDGDVTRAIGVAPENRFPPVVMIALLLTIFG